MGTTRYIGLGIPTILEAFGGRQPPWEWAWKLVFTAVTLGAGFKGGEVTPLFFIGATLGNALSYVVPLGPSLLAGMGFVAVFAGAANTPIASTLMAVELFGAEVGAYAGIACVFAYLVSGEAGIYSSQRVGLAKPRSVAAEEGTSACGGGQGGVAEVGRNLTGLVSEGEADGLVAGDAVAGLGGLADDNGA